jgi:S1-C subfamily serine protease
MWVDILILAFCISAIYRGREIGFVRQACSTIGFFGGLFLGAWLQSYTVKLANTPSGRAVITLITTVGCAMLFLTIGEIVGIYLKQRVVLRRINTIDVQLGAVISIITVLISSWLLASLLSSLPLQGVNDSVKRSHIVRSLNRVLPSAPNLIADLGKLIDPNGFPQVFIGSEPNPPSNIDLPSLGVLRNAVQADRASVVKLEGQGCGGVVEGSGFVVGSNLVATNAHVVAGIRHPYVIDSNGTHSGTVIGFDSNLDFAVLRVPNLAGKSLVISHKHVSPGTAAAVLGYPGGGGFSANVAAVLDQFTASGRNIYGRGATTRDVYELRARIIPGNSGGPLVATDGTVIGVIFAESTSFQNVGYALTTSQVTTGINQAAAGNHAVSTGNCTE